jgi:indole-3-glycerol phosphate synthase
MSKSVLDKIKAYKLVEIQNDKKVKSLSDIEMLAKAAPKVRSFSRALTNKKGSLHTLIAEIKKASPSKGLIRKDFNPRKIAKAYQAGGATCLSVLTDTPSFQGAKHYLNEAKNVTSLPALRKDFMYDTYQVAEARALNADCILIIMASVSDQQAQELEEAAFFWKMDVLLEVHNEIELQRALDLKSKLIGINNRNLKTFETDINITRKLAELVPDNRFIISESGLNSPEDLQDLTSSGASAFLIGESLMRQNDIEFATRNLISKPESEY